MPGDSRETVRSMSRSRSARFASSDLTIGTLTVFVGPASGPGLPFGPPLLCGTGTLYGTPATAIVDAPGFPGTTTFNLPTTMVGQGFVVQGISLETGPCLRLTDPLAVTVHAP